LPDRSAKDTLSGNILRPASHRCLSDSDCYLATQSRHRGRTTALEVFPMPRTLNCPACHHSIPEANAAQCPACHAALGNGASGKGKKKKHKRTAKKSRFPVLWVAVGGGVLAVALLIGGLLLIFGRGRTGRSEGGGSYAVVDSLPDLPAAADDPPERPDPATPRGGPRYAWAAKPDPGPHPVAYSTAVGAPTPEPFVLVAGRGGPFAVGTPASNSARREKSVKSGNPADPWKVVPQADARYPVIDVRTGKEVGYFPASARAEPRSRLSPDGQFLAGWETETDAMTKQGRDFFVVWKRDGDKPVMRWPVPARVYWVEFLGPDRLALYHTGPTPQFVVLDVNKGTPVVTAALPAADFPPTNDLRSGSNNQEYYHDLRPGGGAVSPGGTYVAVGGKTAIALLAAADGRLIGRLGGLLVDPGNYLAIGFDEAGAEVRAAFKADAIYVRAWSMIDGQGHLVAGFALQTPVAGPVLSGPEPGTLILGRSVIDRMAGQAIMEVPVAPLQWAGPDRLLAVAPVSEAVNAKAIQEAVDYRVEKGVFVTAFPREVYRKKVAAFAAGRANVPVNRPPTAPADRSAVVAIQPHPVAWAVKPSPAPPLPAGASLTDWPEHFAATEAATVPLTGRTWIRYDLKTGKTIGEPVRLWPDKVSDVRADQGRLVALSLDGRLAVVDRADGSRVDVWEATGKHLIGLRPYPDRGMDWIGWSADGHLLTACNDLVTSWDPATGKAIFEIEGAFKTWMLAPGRGWLLATTPGGNLVFFDTATGKPLGRIPGLGPTPTFSLSPDSKTLVRPLPAGRDGGNAIQVWDLETGKRSTRAELPVGPVLGTWAGPRHTLAWAPASGSIPDRLLLYDLDMHTHTHWFEAGPHVRADSLGRGWMAPGGRDPKGWTPLRAPGIEKFGRDLVLGPGSTIRVEIDVGSQEYNPKIAKQAAELLQKRGLTIGRGGWCLRADHTTGQSSQQFNDPKTGKRYASPYLALNIDWKLLSPEGIEVWQASNGGTFDPFRSKYVVVGSRHNTFNPHGGGSTQVEIDFQGKDPQAAQIDEILEQTLLLRQNLPAGLPVFVAKAAGGYAGLPLKEAWPGEKKP
jgi:hypothetical protein